MAVVGTYQYTGKLVNTVPVRCANPNDILIEASRTESYSRSDLDPTGVDS
jgi:hypothetical protein